MNRSYRNVLTLLKLVVLSAVTALTFSAPAHAQATANSLVGAGGYDLTTYFTSEKPARGTGHHVAVYEGVTYLFTSDENKKTFQANPQKYLPGYGGYCAFGASIGKKFVADPDVYDIVDNKLYFNLDTKIRGIWAKDIEGNLKKADANWKTIAGKNPADL